MGSDRELPTGVEVRCEAVRIVFRWRGKRYRETLPWAASAGGIARTATNIATARQGIPREATHISSRVSASRRLCGLVLVVHLAAGLGRGIEPRRAGAEASAHMLLFTAKPRPTIIAGSPSS